MGAGVVAIGASQAMPDLKGDSNLGALPTLNTTASTGGTGGGNDLAERERQVAERASRSTARPIADTPEVATVQQPALDVWLLPMRNYQISSLFGPRWGTLHPGMDMTASEGTPYYAAGAGKVILARWNGGYGYNIMIDHGEGIVTIYGHSQKLLVKEGQQVAAGQLIGLSGNTGFSTGPHLHFEIRVNDKPTDPETFMLKRGVDLKRKIEVAKGGVLP